MHEMHTYTFSLLRIGIGRNCKHLCRLSLLLRLYIKVLFLLNLGYNTILIELGLKLSVVNKYPVGMAGD